MFFYRLAEYLEQEPARKKAAAEAQRAKLDALERKLGIDAEAEAGPSSSGDMAQVAGRKHRFDDTEYLEQSRELVDNVKSAVSAGQLSFPPIPLPFLHRDPSIPSLIHCCRASQKAQKGKDRPKRAKTETGGSRGTVSLSGTAGDSIYASRHSETQSKGDIGG